MNKDKLTPSELAFADPEAKNTDTVILSPDTLIIVRDLTAASQRTFDCIRAFHEQYAKTKKDKLPVGAVAVNKVLGEQSKQYSKTISSSITVADKGRVISRNALMILEEQYQADDTCILAMMMIDVSDAHKAAADLEKEFRGIRSALFQAQQDFQCQDGGQQTSFDTELLDKMTLAASELIQVAGKFVQWWSHLKTEEASLLPLIRDASPLARSVWSSLEEQFIVYSQEVKRQQDFYAVPNTEKSKSWLKRISEKVGR
ncbi:hypothetical protein ONZ45_g9709 [Pleurotus djamor]|nr:hypothetical protein ONZ45_g9709 [Pleurotus djamor]